MSIFSALSYRWIRQPAAKERLHLRPNFGIAFDLDMALGKETRIPGKITTLCGLLFVLPMKIAQDCRSGWISGSYFRPAVDQAARLVKVCRFENVGWNHPIVLKWLCHTVHLYREHNRDAFALEFPGQSNHGRGTPTVTKQQYVCPSLF